MDLSSTPMLTAIRDFGSMSVLTTIRYDRGMVKGLHDWRRLKGGCISASEVTVRVNYIRVGVRVRKLKLVEQEEAPRSAGEAGERSRERGGEAVHLRRKAGLRLHTPFSMVGLAR